MIANTTIRVNNHEICIDAMSAEEVEVLKTWSADITEGLQVVRFILNRKHYKLVPGFFSIVNAKLDQAASARRNYEAGRSARLTKETLQFIQEQLDVDYDAARLAIRKIRKAR